MGGNLAWTIRLEDGTEYRMDRWTNIFPWATIEDDFLSGDETAFNERMKSYWEMESDWKANKKTKKFIHNMTDAYAPYPFGLKPSEYGFVVTDFKTKTIVGSQYYTDIDRLYVWREYMNPSKLKGHTTIKGDDFEEEYEKFLNYHAEGRLLSFRSWRQTGKMRKDGRPELESVNYDLRGLAVSDILDLLFVQHQKNTGMTYPSGFEQIKLKPLDPWVVYQFNCDVKAERQLAYDKVKELGFEITPGEDRTWRGWINGRR